MKTQHKYFTDDGMSYETFESELMEEVSQRGIDHLQTHRHEFQGNAMISPCNVPGNEMCEYLDTLQQQEKDQT